MVFPLAEPTGEPSWSSVQAIDRPNSRRNLLERRVPNKWEGTVLKFVSWDICAATAIAVGAMFLVAILDQSPLLLILIIFALCLYIVAQSAFLD
jgi:hypothetical protein